MDKAIEWCSDCQEEVEVAKGIVSSCPNCGEEIRPCSDCDHAGFSSEEGVGCDWTKEKGCRMFLKI